VVNAEGGGGSRVAVAVKTVLHLGWIVVFYRHRVMHAFTATNPAMTITISLPPEMEQKLRQAAAQSGVAPDAFAQKLIETGLCGSPSPNSQSRPETFDEILAPVRKGFEESGMTEDELAALFEEAREEVWMEQQGKKGS
jgi:hypothetical protein